MQARPIHLLNERRFWLASGGAGGLLLALVPLAKLQPLDRPSPPPVQRTMELVLEVMQLPAVVMPPAAPPPVAPPPVAAPVVPRPVVPPRAEAPPPREAPREDPKPPPQPAQQQAPQAPIPPAVAPATPQAVPQSAPQAAPQAAPQPAPQAVAQAPAPPMVAPPVRPPPAEPPAPAATAPLPPAEPPRASPPAAPAAPASASIETGFVAQLRAQLNASKRYPTGREASMQRPSGRVVVWFVLNRNGQLQDVGIVDSSNSILLDNAALTTVRRASFPAWPDSAWAGQSTHRFTATLDFVPQS